jgi:hypothetical protein
MGFDKPEPKSLWIRSYFITRRTAAQVLFHCRLSTFSLVTFPLHSSAPIDKIPTNPKGFGFGA